MRRITYVFILAALLAAVPMPTSTAGDDFKLEPGFMLLFNGKNLDGWREKKAKDTLEGKSEAFKGRFKAADGILTYDPKPGGDRYIETIKEFAKDAHFKFDFKPGPKCNNDVLFRGTKFDLIPGKKGELDNVKEGEWHTFDLVASGDKIEHQIDGKTVRTTKAAAKASTFILRAEIGAMQVKNIRVKE